MSAHTQRPAATGDAEVLLGGQRLVLMPERCAFWPARRWLLAADLHWGKCQAMRARGAPLPGGPLGADLDRLASAMARTGARRLVVLGDMVHARAALTGPVLSTIARWRGVLGAPANAPSPGSPPGRLALIPGNHDRGLVKPSGRLREWGGEDDGVPEALGVRVLPPRLRVGGLVLTHQPPEDPHPHLHPQPVVPPAVVCGHLHPVASMGGRGWPGGAGDRLRLAAFWLRVDPREPPGGGTLVLPAFSSLADGRAITPAAHDAVWVTTGRSVRRVR